MTRTAMADYSFRAVTTADLPMLADWLRTPEVAAWWTDPDGEIADLPDTLADARMTLLIVQRDNQPIAYAQVSDAAQWQAPHYDALTAPAGTLALDVFAGPAGLGHGGDWLDALARHLLTDAPALIIDPDPQNLRAIRAYQKAGFQGDTVLANEDGEPARMMTRYR